MRATMDVRAPHPRPAPAVIRDGTQSDEGRLVLGAGGGVGGVGGADGTGGAGGTGGVGGVGPLTMSTAPGDGDWYAAQGAPDSVMDTRGASVDRGTVTFEPNHDFRVHLGAPVRWRDQARLANGNACPPRFAAGGGAPRADDLVQRVAATHAASRPPRP